MNNTSYIIPDMFRTKVDLDAIVITLKLLITKSTYSAKVLHQNKAISQFKKENITFNWVLLNVTDKPLT